MLRFNNLVCLESLDIEYGVKSILPYIKGKIVVERLVFNNVDIEDKKYIEGLVYLKDMSDTEIKEYVFSKSKKIIKLEIKTEALPIRWVGNDLVIWYI